MQPPKPPPHDPNRRPALVRISNNRGGSVNNIHLGGVPDGFDGLVFENNDGTDLGLVTSDIIEKVRIPLNPKLVAKMLRILADRAMERGRIPDSEEIEATAKEVGLAQNMAEQGLNFGTLIQVMAPEIIAYIRGLF